MDAASRPGRSVIWAGLDFLEPALDVSSNDALFNALFDAGYRDAVDDLVRLLLAEGTVPITPHFSFPMPELPLVPAGFAPEEPVAAEVAVTHTRSDQDEILALCVNAPPGPRPGDAKLIVPFLTSQNYACGLAFEIVRSIIQQRWRSLALPRGFSHEGPFELTDPDDPQRTIEGRARIRFTLLPTQPTVSLVDSPFPLQDALRLVCEEEVQLLELKDENGDTVELGDFAAPVRTPFSWRIQLFDPDPGEAAPATTFLRPLATLILDPLYKPMLEPRDLRGIQGVTLSTRGLVFLRGDLE